MGDEKHPCVRGTRTSPPEDGFDEGTHREQRAQHASRRRTAAHDRGADEGGDRRGQPGSPEEEHDGAPYVERPAQPQRLPGDAVSSRGHRTRSINRDQCGEDCCAPVFRTGHPSGSVGASAASVTWRALGRKTGAPSRRDGRFTGFEAVGDLRHGPFVPLQGLARPQAGVVEISYSQDQLLLCWHQPAPTPWVSRGPTTRNARPPCARRVRGTASWAMNCSEGGLRWRTGASENSGSNC